MTETHKYGETADSPEETWPTPEELVAVNRNREAAFHQQTIVNRPKGPATERPIFDIEPYNQKDELTYEEVAQLAELDRQEYAEIGKRLGCGTDEAIEKVAEHMWLLWAKSLLALAQQHEKKELYTSIVKTPEDEVLDLIHGELRSSFGPLLDDIDMTDMNIEQLQALARKKALQTKSHWPTVETETKKYRVDQSNARWQRPNICDLIVVYDGEYEGEVAPLSLRLNLIQLDLAAKGILYKGERTKDTRNKFMIRDADDRWDQAAYPTSPLAYFETHMQGSSETN